MAKRNTRSKPKRPPDELDQLFDSMRQVDKNKKILNLKAIQELKKQFKTTCDDTKKATQIQNFKNPPKLNPKTRAGAKLEAAKQVVYTDSKWVNKGFDDSGEKYTPDEIDWLEKRLERVQEVRALEFPQLKYLVIDRFLDDLKKIKTGELVSLFHNRYLDLGGKSKSDIFSEVKTNLFTNEQRDYLNGLLLGAFGATDTDANGDIKHSDINYVEIVMLFETTIRIVKFVHKFKSDEETFNFMVQKSREGLGLGEDG